MTYLAPTISFLGDLEDVIDVAIDLPSHTPSRLLDNSERD